MLRRTFLISAAALPLLGCNATASDAVVTDDYVQAFVDRAITTYSVEGPDALELLNDPEGEFREGSLYIFVVNPNDTIVANAGSTTSVWQYVGDLVDTNGFEIGREMRARATEEGVWISYVFMNPETGIEENKRSWVRLHEGMIFGAGIYAAP